MVQIHLNDQILYRINNYQTNDKVTFTINNVEYQINKSFAVAISQKFFSQYLLDNNITHISINTNIKSSDTYNALTDFLLYRRSKIECDETILNDLLHVGLALEIQELIDKYKINVVDKVEIDLKNCVQLLEFYFDISYEEKITECIDFISSHFFEIEQNQLKAISQKFGLSIFQRIFNNDKLKSQDEDSIASFIISLIKESDIFSPLFEIIRFEFCSDEVLNGVQELTNKNNFQSIVKSLLDTIIRVRCQSTFHTNYFESGNVKMSVSSCKSGSPDLINKYRNDAFFSTKNIPNSWVEWKLKDGYAIQPTEYIVRTTPAYKSFSQRLQTWRVEGTTINGETKIIHEVQNSPLKEGEIRKYKLDEKNKFVSFRLIQTGKTADNNYDYLEIDVFDFSGNVFRFNIK